MCTGLDWMFLECTIYLFWKGERRKKKRLRNRSCARGACWAKSVVRQSCFKATSFFSSPVSRKIRFMQSPQQRANHPETGKSLSIKSSGAKMFFFFKKKKTFKLKRQVSQRIRYPCEILSHTARFIEHELIQ